MTLPELVIGEALERSAPMKALKNYESPLFALHRLMDVTLVVAGLWLACVVTDTRWMPAIALAGVVAAALFYFMAVAKHLYRSWRTERVSREILYVAETWLGVAGISLVAIYAQQDAVAYPPQTVFAWFAITPALLIALRLGARYFLRQARAKGYNSRRLAIAGSGDLARHVARVASENPWMGLNVMGLFDQPGDGGANSRRGEERGLRSLDALIKLAREGKVDVIYIALPAGSSERLADQIIRRLSDSTASVYLVQDRRSRAPDGAESSRQTPPDLTRVDVLHRAYVDLGGIKAVSVYESPFLGTDAWVKRAEDVLISSIALLLLAFPMLAIAIGVKLSGPGPVLFKQRRYGLDGRKIMVWKFRSMNVCEDGDKVVQASKNDARVTRFGSFIRKTSLDELPQFFNVLGGSMSIVGPRPHAVAHNEHYRSLIGGYMLRHKVKPGITGWAQVNGWRGETESVEKMGHRIDFDLDYIRNWSLWLDVRIIVMTALSGFTHKNAY